MGISGFRGRLTPVVLVCVLSACSGASSSNNSSGSAPTTTTTTAVTTTAAVSTPLPAPPAAASTYDASVGTGVDASGFASLPLRSGAHRYFVNSSTGADDNGCARAQQPAAPLRTLAAGLSCVADGAGDQVLLAEGTRYAEALPWLAQKNGASAEYPTVIQSYDPGDPGNEAKYGRGDQRGARPVLTALQGQVGNGIYSYLAIRGLDFSPGNVPGSTVSFIGQSNYILMENNLFRYTGVSFDKGDKSPATRHVLRHNSLYGQWNTGGRAGGYYDSGTNGITLEDNVFWHAGWKVGASRDDDPSAGGATVFSHSFYLQTDTTGGLVRRNLSMDAAGDGGIARGDILFTQNVSIDNPACVGLGGGPSYGTDRPAGVSIEASYNACLGDADVNSSHTLGWGINTANGVAGSRVHHNLLARTRDPNGPSVGGFSNGAFFDQPSYAAFDNNLLYLWVKPGGTYYALGGAFPAQAHSTYDNNIWDDPSSGTNRNNAGMTFPNAYSSTSLFPALGCGDKANCVAKMIETPEFPWGAKAREVLFAGYGLQ